MERKPPLKTAEPVADRLGTSKQQVYTYAREGKIPHVRVGRRVLFDMDKIEAWLENGGGPASNAA